MVDDPGRRGHGARRRSGHRVRRRHRVRRCGAGRRQAHRRADGGAGVGGRRRSTAPRRTGCATTAFRCSKVPAAGWRRMGHLVRWPLPVDTPAGPAPVAPRNPRTDASAFDVLATYGIPVVESRTAESIDEVLAAAAAVGYPVALKTLGALHKSDVGGVALDLADAEALRAAYTAMARCARPSRVRSAHGRRRASRCRSGSCAIRRSDRW